MTFLLLILYLATAFAWFRIFEKAGVDYAWLAFIPVLMFIPYFRLLNRSAWNILWAFVPIVNIMMGIIWQVEFFQAFGFSGWLALLALVPFVNLIVLFIIFYIAFSQDVEYQG